MSEILAKTLSFGVSGVNGFPVRVEVFATGGMPMIDIIGLPDTSVRESKNRVMAAIVNSGKSVGTETSKKKDLPLIFRSLWGL